MTRRREMWKLLYSVVNRSESNLSQVYNVVDDILCQEPSLISCSELNSKFQDAFLLWLLNKLAKCILGNTSSSDVSQCIELQKKLLSSCWSNHPKLFKRLVEAYIEVLQEIQGQLSELQFSQDAKNQNNDKTLTLKIFTCEVSCLEEFDSQCSFNEIHVKLDQIDGYAKNMLIILQHAHSIGHATHSGIFADSMEQALLILKECDVETKLMSLIYCHQVLKMQSSSSWQSNANVPHFAQLCLKAVTMMWSMVPKWLEVKLMTQLEIGRLVGLTKDILLELQLPGKESLDVGYHLINEILAVTLIMDKNDLIKHLSNYLQKQINRNPGSLELLQHLAMSKWRTYPTQLMPLLCSMASIQIQLRPIVVSTLSKALSGLLEKTDALTPLEVNQMLSILKGLKELEHLLLHQQQQKLANDQGENINNDLLIKFPLQYELILPTDINWNQHALAFVEQEESQNRKFSTGIYYEICSYLMQISCIRLYLKSQTQHQLLGILQRNHQLGYLCSIRLETPSSAHTQLQTFLTQEFVKLFTSQENEIMDIFLRYFSQLYMCGYIRPDNLIKGLTRLVNPISRCQVLRLLLCAQSGTIQIFKVDDQIVWYCNKCRPLPETLPGLYLGKHKTNIANFNFTGNTYQLIAKDLLFQPDCEFIVQHIDLLKSIEPQLCLRLIKEGGCEKLNKHTMSLLVPVMTSSSPQFMKELAISMLTCIQRTLAKSLQTQSIAEQRKLLQLVVACAHPGITEIWLFHWFKMTFFFMVNIRSLVVQEAVLAASEMCARHDLQTVTLWNWYKRDALALAVRLALIVYLSDGVRFTRSLRALSKMLGFSCVQEFTCKYHRLLTTMVLPYCIKEPRCKGVLVLISKQLRKPIATLFATSFLRIYTHVHLTETPELANSCIEFVVKCTKCSLHQLMNADVKQTVAELLIYFNRNPTFIMRSFQSLLQSSQSNSASESDQLTTSSQTANAEFAAFIAERFLGVITHFESCLGESSFEKPLKDETLYSLGQIMRLVGSHHVTQFRFKIIAMLTFVHTLQESRLQRICLKIWHIFLHVVNVQELGPSLGRIVATLQPLLNDKETVDQVNDLYEFVILRNASMLGNFITDLYFLENMENVSPAIRQCIKRHTAHLHLTVEEASSDQPRLLVQLQFLHKHITDECLQVRIYGLQHLGAIFGRRRAHLNRMILNELPMEPLIEQIVNVLVAGCQHDDRQLQMASAKCLGELGAIDASYLPSNYNFSKPQQQPLSVLSDEFTILALTSLCRGYQFQQNTKHVDSFSLAIQETLAVCGISPKEKKKVQLWQSLPSRMRQVMEPMLYSCYTSSQRPCSCKEQPIFGSHYTKNSYEEWAFLWASRLIDYIQSTETRHLLSSYKPCIKRDANMLSTFYPYILLHALLECTQEQHKHIQEEFMAVLQANEEFSVFKSQQELRSRKDKGFKLFESRKYSAGVKPVLDTQEREEDTSHVPRLAGKLCAELLDFLQRWLREWQRLHGRSTGGKPPQTVDGNYKSIYEFLEKIPKLLVSHASYNCGEYPRALSYLESYLEEGDKAKRILEQFTFLVEIYGKLMDSDSVEGAVQVRSFDMSVTQEILVNRLVERQQDMITCYEQLLSSTDELQPEHIRAIIDAYLRMDTPKTALLIADGLWQRLSDQYTEQYFSECKSELLWRLGSYEELEKEAKPNWPAQCAQGCLALRQPLTSHSQFNSLLDGMRNTVLEQLRSCSALQQHSYAHAYGEVVKLHLVHELQCSQVLLEKLQLEEKPGQISEERQKGLIKKYFEDWQLRLQVLQPQVRVLEPIYSFRRNLLAELQRRLSTRTELCSSIQTELGQLWLNSAQINRNAGQLQRAQLYILKAAEYQPTGLFLERAKLLWQKGDQVMAINYLEEQLSLMRQDQNAAQLPTEQRKLYFEGKYLLAIYNAESMNLCADAILKFFRDAIAVQRQSEGCHVQFAQFLEKIREAKQAGSNKPATTTPNHADDDMLLQVMLYYAKSLRYGSDHIYQSMPRLISLWLDTAETTVNSDLIKKMNDLLTNCSTVLPTAMFYTAYSQMLSRLCHPQGEVFSVLRIIIIRLVEDYPQQSLWMLLPHFKSATANRIKRAKLILTESRLQNATFQKLLGDFNTLTERLIGLTNKEVTLDRSYQLSDLDKRLSKLCNQDFSNILLPFEKYMRPTLPISSTDSTLAINTENSIPTANWFPYQHIYICGFQEQVVVLRSAAKPKKLTIRCSDGQNYDVLVKPKDDLRRDARLMEFNGLVKRYLHQDALARQRRLYIRTYAVLPFNEECGLVEWLPNLNSYRGICTSLYAQKGQGMGARQLQQTAVPLNDSIERKRDVFLKILLPAHPPVFQEWLRQRFTTPHSWYEARNSYIRTTAVMSMVGYILGLGDRHGENILIDEHNADVVHVDFNCLFNQGESLAYPEVVPFRLTQNMTVAMGPLGVEGSYRKCCEITLRLLKQESKTLMSMLRPFVYDLGSQRCSAAATAKITNDVQRIADRLQGHVTRHQANSIPLSTEGQVNYLINEATKVDNLAVMYIGWGSFL